MPHISAYDLSFDSDEEEDVLPRQQRRKMLVDEILEENDAKLEQEKARKLEEERNQTRSESTVAKSLGDLSPPLSQLPTNDTPETDLFPDIPLGNTFKVSPPLTSFVPQTTSQKRPSVKIPKSTFTIRNSFGTRLFGEKPPPQPNPKVFVRISDCAQTAAPIRVRIREGSISEMEPEKEKKLGVKSKNGSPPKPATQSKLEDPFSDLPSDLLPGLYELPNLGFNEGTTSAANTDKKDLNSIPKASQIVYEKHIHAYSKSYDQAKKDVNFNEAKVAVKIPDTVQVKTEPVDEPLLKLKISDKGKAGGEDDDGSYVVIVIPKHATVDDVMRTLRTAGTQQKAAIQDGTSRIMLKRKSSSMRIPKKTYIKRIKEDDATVLSSQSLLKVGLPIVQQAAVKPTIKPEPKSDLNASCTLAAMSMLAAAEKGITGAKVGSIVKPDPDVVTIEEPVEESTSPTVSLPPNFSLLDPKTQSRDFGVYNDHTYATLQFRYTYTLPDVAIQLEAEPPVPDAAAMVTIDTEDLKVEEVANIVKETHAGVKVETRPTGVKVEARPTGVKVESVCKEEEEVAVVKEEKLEDKCDEVLMETEHDGEEEADVNSDVPEDIEDDTACRRSRRLSLKPVPKWGPGGTLKEKPSKGQQIKQATSKQNEQVTEQTSVTNKRRKEGLERNKRLASRHEVGRSRRPSRSSDEGVKWQLFPSKLRCRLCEVMCRQLVEMKEHIVQVHGNQDSTESTTSKRTRSTRSSKARDFVIISDILSDFEVSALSAIVRLCPTCDKYVPESRIANHLENHAAFKVACEVCKATFKNQTKLNIHKDICSSLKRDCKCKVCGKEYSSKADLSLHQRFSHQDTRRKKRYQCKRCHKVCRSMGALKVHVAVHFTIKPYECSECGKGFSQKINMEYHRRIHTSGDNSYQCDLCPEGFAQAANLKTHKKKKHGSDMLKKRKV